MKYLELSLIFVTINLMFLTPDQDNPSYTFQVRFPAWWLTGWVTDPLHQVEIFFGFLSDLTYSHFEKLFTPQMAWGLG